MRARAARAGETPRVEVMYRTRKARTIVPERLTSVAAAEDPHFSREIFQAAPGIHGNVTPEILIEAELDRKCRGRRGGMGLSGADTIARLLVVQRRDRKSEPEARTRRV